MEEKKNVALWHPDVGKQMFTPSHAANLLKQEESRPNSWCEYANQDKDTKEPSPNNQTGIDAAGDSTDSINTEGKPDTKSSVNPKGKRTRKQD